MPREAKGNSLAARVRRKLSYGWVVAIAGAGAAFAAANFQYTFGVFVKPLANEFGWSRAAVSGSVSIRSATSVLTAPLVGVLSDRYGPKKFILAGILLVGLSYLLASRITSLWQLYLFLSVLIGIGVTNTLVPVVATVTRWFGHNSALANGIVMSGLSLAQVILPPVATYLMIQYGWDTCFIILGLTAWVLGIVAWRFIKSPPPNMVKQTLATPREGDTSEISETPAEEPKDYMLSEALRTRTLWILLLVQMVIALCYQMMVIHVIAAANDTGITLEAAAIILTLSGITNTVGRLGMGGLAGKIGNQVVLAFCMALQAVALFLLAGASTLYAFYLAATIFGLGYGGVSPIVVALAGSFFGTRAIGAIFGVANITFNVGVAIGPFLAGYIFDTTGSYYIAFFSAAIATVITLLLCLLMKPPQRKALAA
ncbi:MFS transporter [Chloroflexota bacterium]